MEKKHFVVPAGGSAKKYMITFAIALVVAAVVIAIFSLVTNRHTETWLSGDSGAARENMFPFVFTSGKSLYVLDEKLSVNSVDDTVENVVHDVGLSKIYYTRQGVLYEYDIKADSRNVVCSGVSSFALFKERRSIVFSGQDGGIYVYLYNGKKIERLRGAYGEGETAESSFVSGKSHFAYLSDYNEEKGTAKLYVSDLLGKTKCIAENVNAGGAVYIWEEDSAVSYYKENLLVVADMNGNVKFSLENAAVVTEAGRNYATEACTEVRRYGGEKNIRYITTEVSKDGDKAVLQYVDVNGDKFSLKAVASDVKSIVEVCEQEELVVYTAEKNAENFDVFVCRKGGTPKKIMSCKNGTTLYYDTNSHFLFIKRTEKKLSYIDTNDKKLCETVLYEDAGSVYPYVNKPFAVFHNSDETLHGILLKNKRLEYFSASEARLYGKYDDEYLMCRNNENGMFSLDYVKDGKLTRINGNVGRNVIFDKTIKNVVYLSDGELRIWQRDKDVSLGEFPEGIEAVSVVAEKID